MTTASKMFLDEIPMYIPAYYNELHVESAVVIGTRKYLEVTNMYKLFLS